MIEFDSLIKNMDKMNVHLFIDGEEVEESDNKYFPKGIFQYQETSGILLNYMSQFNQKYEFKSIFQDIAEYNEEEEIQNCRFDIVRNGKVLGSKSI